MRSYGWLLATLIMASSASGVGAQGARSVNIGDAGRDTCAAWSQDRDAASDTARQAKERRVEWVLGFFSAVNFFNNQDGNLHGGIDDQNGMLAWIDNYCGGHPKDPLFVAAVDLVFDLRNNPRK